VLPGVQKASSEGDIAEAARGIIIIAMSALATCTIIAHVGLILGVTFKLYAWTVAIAIVAAVALTLRWEFGTFLSGLRTSPGIAITLTVSGSLAALATHYFHYEYTDDHLYIPNIIYYVGHPDEAISLAIHFVDIPGKSDHGFFPGATMPIALLQGATAYFLKLTVLDVYYVLSPVLLGFLQPLIWFFLLTRFGLNARAAVFGALVICLSIPLMGELHRSFGNYGLNRIWHGKATLMSLGLPLFAALTVDYLGTRTPGAWLRLFICATAQVGLSTASVLLIPILSLLLAAAAAVSFPRKPSDTLRMTLLYGLSQWYIVAFGLVYFYMNRHYLDDSSTVNVGFPPDFVHQSKLVLLGAKKSSLILMITSLVGAFLFMSGWQRRFIAAWTLFCCAALLNPVVAPFLIEHVTTANIYWRLFYLLPFPLAMGLVSGIAAHWFQFGSRISGTIFGTVCLLLLASLHTAPWSTSILNYGTSLKPGYKIDEDKMQFSRSIAEMAPPGSMLAPIEMSRMIPMVSPDHPQIVALGKTMNALMSRDERALRRVASRLLEEKRIPPNARPPNPDVLLTIFEEHPDIRSVVVRKTGIHHAEVVALLLENGFTLYRSSNSWEIYWRPV